MQIRNAAYKDAPAIRLLLGALGYNGTMNLLVNQLETLFGREDSTYLFMNCTKRWLDLSQYIICRSGRLTEIRLL